MLGFIKGKLIAKNPETSQAIIQTHRLGFEVTLPKVFFDTLVMQQTVTLWLHTHVREDLLVLYGFNTEHEKHFFRVLIGVSGLGPKTALSLLGEHGPEKLSQFILRKEIDSIAEAPGVGKKLAQRLVLELSGKLEKLAWLQGLQKGPTRPEVTPVGGPQQFRDDLSSALANLGYAPQQIKTTLDRMLVKNAELGFEVCLRTALKELRPSVSTRGNA